MNKQNQNGSVHVAIFVIVVAILLIAVGYLFWNNFINKDSNSNEPVATKESEPNKSSLPVSKEDNGEKYLVLDDYDIKFKLPESIGEIRYYKKSAEPNTKGMNDFYEFTTKRVEELGGQCIEPNAQGNVIRLASIGRTKQKQEALASAAFVNNNEPIDGYYYYVSGGQAPCSDDGADMQNQDRNLLSEILLYPIAM